MDDVAVGEDGGAGNDEGRREDDFARLLGFLNRLDAAHIGYDLKHTRLDSIMVCVAQPGWRWEIEFMADGIVDIERFRSPTGVESDPRLLEELFRDD